MYYKLAMMLVFDVSILRRIQLKELKCTRPEGLVFYNTDAKTVGMCFITWA